MNMKKRILSFIIFTEAEQLEEWQLNNEVEIADNYPTTVDEEGDGIFITYWKWVEIPE
jgi:hypothetical protein